MLHYSKLIVLASIMSCFINHAHGQKKMHLDLGLVTNTSFYSEYFSEGNSPFSEARLNPMVTFGLFVKGRYQSSTQSSFSLGIGLNQIGARGENGYFEKGTYLHVPLEWRNQIKGPFDFVAGMAYDYALEYNYVAAESFFFLDTRHFFTPKIGLGFSNNQIRYELSYNYSLTPLYDLNFTDMNGEFLGRSTTRFTYVQFSFCYSIGLGRSPKE